MVRYNSLEGNNNNNNKGKMDHFNSNNSSSIIWCNQVIQVVKARISKGIHRVNQ